MPNWIFTACIIGTQIVALFFSVYGVFGEAEGVAPCGYPWGLAVLGISLVYFMILDAVKVQIFRRWSFEMTAKMIPTKGRKNKLTTRKERMEKKTVVDASWKKLIDPVEAHQIIEPSVRPSMSGVQFEKFKHRAQHRIVLVASFRFVVKKFLRCFFQRFPIVEPSSCTS